MYNENFLNSLELLFLLEGGDKYHEIEHDSGGATKYGISLKFYKTIYPNSDKHSIKNLTKDEAINLYWNYFYHNLNYDKIENFKISRKLFLTAVNMGKTKPNKWSQLTCNELGSNLVVDGILGTSSINDINKYCSISSNLDYFKNSLINKQIDNYYKIVEKNQSQKKFLKGWLNRAKII